MNKKGHHEAGITPYVILAGILGFIVLYLKKIANLSKTLKRSK